ncbi:unnamed protein product [Brassica rapa]|uniref:Uncharacterized protein n=1 Tax=Brassica campestris TaxID=3711 RepID=A0A8D9HZR5_BRACM|nr:unnamed protein product [Brassica rapa]
MIFRSYSGNRIYCGHVGRHNLCSLLRHLLLYKQKLVCCLRDSPRIHLRLLIYA